MNEFILDEFCRALITQATKLCELASKKTLEYTSLEAVLKIWRAHDIIAYSLFLDTNIDHAARERVRNILKRYCTPLKIGESSILYLNNILLNINIQHLKGLEIYF